MNASNRIALVTGAGTGIGKAAALALGEAGFTLVLTGRRREPLDAVAAELGDKGHVVTADVADPPSVATLFETVAAQFGRLDLLFNNAGGWSPGAPIEDIPLSDWHHVVNVNLTGVFLCTQAAIRLMKAQDPKGGRIINNGSISAHAPRPFTAPYTATKHAISGLTKQVALEGRAHNIACGQIDIGNADTDMAAKMKSGIIQPNGQIMVEPTFDPAHAGRAVAYMAGLPLDANVLTMTIMATNAPFVGRG
ncbi:NAD(P)-dependent dehydrogenase (short-subunit alcohol dehydrogenase family) [Angulomicrobium tetraedrale]|uniref:NAD(P)-dependent dehydrogenase (Short-subunit alcohol dehydrogenase family) n=1 Tax=Ancylobacter tetraedralis TaxID=217068 RepID=A0A839Z886_9HYPH|nr:SDR family oxidoreductase [Ancylobacter tetraedralis]MBB3771423.1 NAD(P)-dependent dehydrogenase (short-subunit alcohol dehydrogenase family) [Ancylobacter tetraedralis]